MIDGKRGDVWMRCISLSTHRHAVHLFWSADDVTAALLALGHTITQAADPRFNLVISVSFIAGFLLYTFLVPRTSIGGIKRWNSSKKSERS
ncbi:hypothetical protein Y032_0066g3716 [Ancylostoma ceylanicum]|uniref:Uncharacterized protein n=1 Tax=Ancylostoma ceylanicum TaxID=53326 RepID=A0A016TZ47_9BILA|nr:hypothetical protein Y032_0066g3716 [Ancylostoma ceylanicum]